MPSKRVLRDGRGQTAVEMALVLPILIMCLIIMLDLGRGVYCHVALSNAVREGARRAIVITNPSGVIVSAVVNSAVGLDLSAANVGISGSRAPGGRITVTASYDFAPITPFLSMLVGSTIHMDAQASMISE